VFFGHFPLIPFGRVSYTREAIPSARPLLSTFLQRGKRDIPAW
jgi:hypothetical protein